MALKSFWLMLDTPKMYQAERLISMMLNGSNSSTAMALFEQAFSLIPVLQSSGPIFGRETS
jgi:hypothetical protein